MGYAKNSDDNGRVNGTFEDFTVDHVVGKFEYDKKDRSGNDKVSEETRNWDEEFGDVIGDNDTDEVVREVTSDSEEIENG